MTAYEEQLDKDVRWAFREGSMHFEKESAVHKALEKITRRLDELGVPYAVAGAMAMFYHGFRRFTEDVDILVTRQGIGDGSFQVRCALIENRGGGWHTPFAVVKLRMQRMQRMQRIGVRARTGGRLAS